jgi:transcription antitermination protein NusB
MPRTRVETRARARVLQALYAWDLRDGGTKSGEGVKLERVAAQIWDDLAVPPEERRIAGPLVRIVAQHRAQLDTDLADVTTNWRLERLGVVERSVLRMAAAELMAGETPPRVVIQEGVKLAERYGSVQSAKFVNGVLDALARRMGRI